MTRSAAITASLAAGLGIAAAAMARWGGADATERAVAGPPPPPAAVWVHGASVGELVAARPLIAALAARHAVLVTANTVTGRDRARSWGLPAVLAPLDADGPLRRFLRAVRPAVQVTVENEIWPLRAHLLDAAGVARFVVGARLSARSAARWRWLPGVVEAGLRGLAGLSAQDAASEARLRALGLPPAALVPRLDLKRLGPASLAPVPASAARDAVILAASTHAGEEAAILDAFAAARAQRPDLRLILAPRHPPRGDAVAALVAARGWPLLRRSAGACLDDAAPVLLADTLGEMDRWTVAAGLCLTGGSWTDRGGHTPWEAAARCCAIVHGPHVANFSDAYAALDAAGAALAVGGADLPGAIAALAADRARLRRMGAAARAALDAGVGDPAPLLARIEAALDAARRRG